MENNNKLLEHHSYHVPVQYIQGSQSGPVNRCSSPTDSKIQVG